IGRLRDLAPASIASATSLSEHVRVARRRLDAGVTERLLHEPHVAGRAQELGREVMPEVRGIIPRFHRRLWEGILATVELDGGSLEREHRQSITQAPRPAAWVLRRAGAWGHDPLGGRS